MEQHVTTISTTGGPGLALGLRSIAFMSDINFKLQLAGPKTMDFVPVTPAQSVRLVDQGIRLVAQVVDGQQRAVNIRPATVRLVKLMKPDGTTVDVSGSLLSSGADGKLFFLSTVFVPPYDQTGEWWVQVKLVIGGVSQSTQWANFSVEPNIDAN